MIETPTRQSTSSHPCSSDRWTQSAPRIQTAPRLRIAGLGGSRCRRCSRTLSAQTCLGRMTGTVGTAGPTSLIGSPRGRTWWGNPFGTRRRPDQWSGSVRRLGNRAVPGTVSASSTLVVLRSAPIQTRILQTRRGFQSGERCTAIRSGTVWDWVWSGHRSGSAPRATAPPARTAQRQGTPTRASSFNAALFVSVRHCCHSMFVSWSVSIYTRKKE